MHAIWKIKNPSLKRKYRKEIRQQENRHKN